MPPVFAWKSQLDMPSAVYGPCGVPHATREHTWMPYGLYPGITEPAKVGGYTVELSGGVVVACTSA